MAQSITTSIRLPPPVRSRLEKLSRMLKKGKNGVIIAALADYFRKMEQTGMKEEARRQSLLASGRQVAQDCVWEADPDFDDWQA